MYTTIFGATRRSGWDALGVALTYITMFVPRRGRTKKGDVLMDAFTAIDYRLDGAVAVARLNQPERLNAMTAVMGAELLAAIRRAAGEARALVIGCQGNAFSAGANLHQLPFALEDPERDFGVPLDTGHHDRTQLISFSFGISR